jgi:hypothetical protein
MSAGLTLVVWVQWALAKDELKTSSAAATGNREQILNLIIPPFSPITRSTLPQQRQVYVY